MQLYTIETGFFKLDGGAMFGVVPKSLWNRLNPADENNMCNWAMRCLLVEDGNRLILIDNGFGTKQDERFRSFYYLNGDATLQTSLHKHGFSETDITDMFLSHLHFDHCGGGVVRSKNHSGFELTFPAARYWSHSKHWKWATEPNPREKASFLTENILPMQQSGHLNFVDEQPENSPFTKIWTVNGHTESMLIPKITLNGKTVCFMADLIPSAGHIPIPYVMGYDTRPLLTLEEKTSFLKEAADNGYILFLEHDPIVECCTVQHTEKGVRLKDTGTLRDFLG